MPEGSAKVRVRQRGSVRAAVREMPPQWSEDRKQAAELGERNASAVAPVPAARALPYVRSVMNGSIQKNNAPPVLFVEN